MHLKMQLIWIVLVSERERESISSSTSLLSSGLSSKDIITYLTSKGAVIDASMKRHIRAELMKGARKGELDYYEDEYTRRKYFLRYWDLVNKDNNKRGYERKEN